ncbi:MAG: hypothetical protein A2931_03880 [Candidatus Niyogibacteria bacterium RIFCSPLOWO2_01_FULL_45_48]|uniref:GtrA/DPMS transmembrane domain-containing protein n=2 Tax=Candidatus Niyogiibacteriota TaxID=1817912 RepID=A0A1G2EZ27_9BACT|nr:MAG: hypothetical protein A2835_00830 [Candidatus Niyogibacteria bacterium RIFCSPHIGHO2_01_FULL_45_28]OGZ30650.1 MAG: hypothetical protein A3J00_00580 [Candidatus Niyogibacteria bacterium RIFCSPLOWO2_02_FULL_45_13]OGZ31512.1 MAG: hypothetical protein A2931_03880 [Candidatus Niyogibacteria bacterium RIFCSPLOWO2_01_FULL_45_48]
MKNHILAVFAGFLTGVLLIPTLRNLDLELPYETAALVFALPVMFLLGSVIAVLVGRKFPWFWQLAKFGEVGFLNTAIDFGILNFLIFITGFSAGLYFSVFKAASFIVANINSYVWNRFWVFETRRAVSAKEYVQFLVVSLVAITINVGVASLVVNFISARFGLSPALWANLGAAAGVASGLLWNFIGYKLIVFKK